MRTASRSLSAVGDASDAFRRILTCTSPRSSNYPSAAPVCPADLPECARFPSFAAGSGDRREALHAAVRASDRRVTQRILTGAAESSDLRTASRAGRTVASCQKIECATWHANAAVWATGERHGPEENWERREPGTPDTVISTQPGSTVRTVRPRIIPTAASRRLHCVD